MKKAGPAAMASPASSTVLLAPNPEADASERDQNRAQESADYR